MSTANIQMHTLGANRPNSVQQQQQQHYTANHNLDANSDTGIWKKKRMHVLSLLNLLKKKPQKKSKSYQCVNSSSNSCSSKWVQGIHTHTRKYENTNWKKKKLNKYWHDLLRKMCVFGATWNLIN